jgi:hypothetical protein
MIAKKGADRILWKAAFSGDAGNLKLRGCRRNVWIETGG